MIVAVRIADDRYKCFNCCNSSRDHYNCYACLLLPPHC